MSTALESCLYKGRVRHRRFRPRRHEFDYAVTYLYLDLDEVEAVFARSRLMSHERPNLIAFRRRHYHGPPQVDLANAVRDTVERDLGRRPQALDVDELGNLYILDRDSGRISVYQPDGQLMATLGPQLPGGLELRNPLDLAVDGAGRLLVVDGKLSTLVVVE